MPTIDLTQGRLHYRVAGPRDSRAPAVIFVHAFLTDGSLWTQVADRLAADGIRSYAPDWPLGSQPVPLNPNVELTPRSAAGMIIEFLDRLQLDAVTLVGSDTGGALCQFAIDDDPSRIGRLVLTNSDAFEVFPPAQFKLLFAMLRSETRIRLLAKQMRITALRQSPLGFGLLAHDLPAKLTRRWIEPVLTERGVAHDLARFLRAVEPSELIDAGSRLHHFSGPVTIAWGADDRAFGADLGRRLHDHFTDSRLVPVPDSRAFVALDAPDLLAEEIVAIAARSGQPTG